MCDTEEYEEAAMNFGSEGLWDDETVVFFFTYQALLDVVMDVPILCDLSRKLKNAVIMDI